MLIFNDQEDPNERFQNKIKQAKQQQKSCHATLKIKPSQVKNQAINIAKLTSPTFSNHLALPGAPYTHLALSGASNLTCQNLKKSY